MLRRAGRGGALARRRAWLCRRAERENLKRRRLPTPSRRLAVSLGGRFNPGHRYRPAEDAALAMLTIPCSARQPLLGNLGRPPTRRESLAHERSGPPLPRGAGGRTRTRTGLSALRIFVPATAFAAAVRRLGSGLSLHPARPRLRCCPSSLYTFPGMSVPRLGSGLPLQRFPRLWAVLHRRFPGVHSICSSPLRLPISPRPHLAANLTTVQDRAKPKLTMRRRR